MFMLLFFNCYPYGCFRLVVLNMLNRVVLFLTKKRVFIFVYTALYTLLFLTRMLCRPAIDGACRTAQ
jgi:hypothetical protein